MQQRRRHLGEHDHHAPQQQQGVNRTYATDGDEYIFGSTASPPRSSDSSFSWTARGQAAAPAAANYNNTRDDDDDAMKKYSKRRGRHSHFRGGAAGAQRTLLIAFGVIAVVVVMSVMVVMQRRGGVTGQQRSSERTAQLRTIVGGEDIKQATNLQKDQDGVTVSVPSSPSSPEEEQSGYRASPSSPPSTRTSTPEEAALQRALKKQQQLSQDQPPPLGADEPLRAPPSTPPPIRRSTARTEEYYKSRQPQELTTAPPQRTNNMVSAMPGESQENAERRHAIRSAFHHAWAGYKKFAFGHDEVRPVSNITNDSWGGFGATLIDGLDTAILMGHNNLVQEARKHIEQLDFDQDMNVSFFETGIRVLGGLLGAYEVSGRTDRLYLDKARALADRLLPSFESNPSGLPSSVINLRTGVARNHGWNGESSILSEVGSIQLEFAYLSHHTGDPKYARISRRVFSVLEDMHTHIAGMYAVYIGREQEPEYSGERVTMGSLADSFYEYLLKLWWLTDRKDTRALNMYNKAVRGMIKHLVKHKQYRSVDGSTETNYAFIGEFMGPNSFVAMQEHLSCFVPGLLALGAALGRDIVDNGNAIETDLRQQSSSHLKLAESLTFTCAEVYFHSPTGLAPDSIYFHDEDTDARKRRGEEAEPLASTNVVGTRGAEVVMQKLEDERKRHSNAYWETRDREAKLAELRRATEEAHGGVATDAHRGVMGPNRLFWTAGQEYLLRPETIESIFVMWRATGDPKYREWGWTIFKAIEFRCRTPTAYSGIKDVTDDETPLEQNWNDSMQSFFLAETLKYLYLLFSPPEMLSLKDYVFTTEGHPLSVLKSE